MIARWSSRVLPLTCCLSRDSDPNGALMARALAVRVGLSVAIFLLVLFAYLMGWIQPTGIPIGGG